MQLDILSAAAYTLKEHGGGGGGEGGFRGIALHSTILYECSLPDLDITVDIWKASIRHIACSITGTTSKASNMSRTIVTYMSRTIVFRLSSPRLYITVCLLCLVLTLVILSLNNDRGPLERTATASLFSPRELSSSYHGNRGETRGVWESPVRLQFDCSNIHQINITRKLGSGGYRTGFLGMYRGRNVVLKMVTNASHIFTSCQREHVNVPTWETRWRFFTTQHMMKEILLLQQLKHPNFVDLLGFCARGDDINSMSLQEHGIIAVYEYGDNVNVADMELWPLSRRLDIAIQLLDLAVYAEHSPLGPIRLGDMKQKNFRLFGPRIKFSDADFQAARDPQCSSRSRDSRCGFNLPCVKNRCLGYNDKVNLMKMNKVFLTQLLRSPSLEEKTKSATSAMKAVNNKLHSVRSELNVLNVTASTNSTDIYRKLINIRDMLQN